MTDFNSRVADTSELLLSAAQDQGFQITDDNRIGLSDAARLVGLKPGYMRQIVATGEGPHAFDIGFGRHRKSVRLFDLAYWLETRRG